MLVTGAWASRGLRAHRVSLHRPWLRARPVPRRCLLWLEGWPQPIQGKRQIQASRETPVLLKEHCPHLPQGDSYCVPSPLSRRPFQLSF